MLICRYNRKAVPSSSPRLPLRLPWDLEATIFPTLKGVVPGWIESKMKHIAFKTGATALRLTDPISFRSQRSRNGNVGLKDATALRLIPPRKSTYLLSIGGRHSSL